jgi:hypothetical protein
MEKLLKPRVFGYPTGRKGGFLRLPRFAGEEVIADDNDDCLLYPVANFFCRS